MFVFDVEVAFLVESLFNPLSAHNRNVLLTVRLPRCPLSHICVSLEQAFLDESKTSENSGDKDTSLEDGWREQRQNQKQQPQPQHSAKKRRGGRGRKRGGRKGRSNAGQIEEKTGVEPTPILQGLGGFLMTEKLGDFKDDSGRQVRRHVEYCF